MSKAIILISLFVFAGVIAASPLDNFSSLWASWKLRHGKNYAGAEDKSRYNIFIENVKKIMKHNAGDHTYQLGINKFADLTADEFKKGYTGGSKATTQDNVGKDNFPLKQVGDLPEAFDWRTKGAVTRVKDQGQCGSCWTFSATGAIEGFYFNKEKKLLSFSEQQIVDCDKEGEDAGCKGGWHYTAIEYAGKNGLETETDYPYHARDQKCKFDSSRAVKTNAGYAFVKANNTEAFKDALVNQGPVSVAIQADQDVFQFYTRGVITSGCGRNLDHAVLTVGYKKVGKLEAFIVKNSWGSGWGDKGYVMISSLQSAAVNKGQGVCGILAIPVVVN